MKYMSSDIFVMNLNSQTLGQIILIINGITTSTSSNVFYGMELK